MAEPRRFVVLAGQRTGSTWVVSSLDEHPDVACFGEMFYAAQSSRVPPHGRDDHVNWPTWVREGGGSGPRSVGRYLDALYRPRDDASAVGFKLMYPQAAKNPWLIPALTRRRVLVVHVVRTNALDVIVSQEMARARGAYHSSAEGGSENPTIRLDAGALLPRVKRHERKVAAGRAAIRGALLPVVELRYENLLRDSAREFDRVLTRLGVPPAPAGLTGEVRRLNTAPHEETIENYDEVARLLRGSGRAHLLERPA